ncbi:peptide ABC transporter substrate-binding protein [Pseudomonas sp. SDI]|uniref:FecR family protein n=1 Tax=Pseudomonas sp. SDI TaxID=2170734 RepID=UPI000DE659AD|nr:FecR family protein [Pseudomonas sp. SDI]PWB30556.1 peptide ABC transporter substrate-binding protein [Pseudomonas sp. SDI]
MNQTSLSAAELDAITDAAAHWCMRLHAEDCTAAERAAFEQWRSAHPLHAQEWEAMQEIWLTADHLPRPALAPVIALPVATRRRSRTLRHCAAAAAITLLALPVGAWIGWEQGWVPNRYEHFESGNALTHVTLGDGSTAELNLGTELRYMNFKDERRATLVKGEAFFKVQHDSQHPFVVRAGSGQTKVTGTQFNVWKYGDAVKVTLVEGSVLVTSDANDTDSGYRLGPGMQAVYHKGDYEPVLSQTYADDTSLAWRGGKLILDNLTLDQALPLINRYLEQPLRLADSSTGHIRISGIYNITEVKRLVSSLPKVLPIYLTQDKQGYTVLNRIALPPAKG